MSRQATAARSTPPPAVAEEGSEWRAGVPSLRDDPGGWTRRETDDSIVAMNSGSGEIALRWRSSTRRSCGDEDVMLKILEGHWTKISSCRFNLFGASATRGDFQVHGRRRGVDARLLEWHEGASPGRKFVFHAQLGVRSRDHDRMLPAFEKFMQGLAPDLDGRAWT